MRMIPHLILSFWLIGFSLAGFCQINSVDKKLENSPNSVRIVYGCQRHPRSFIGLKDTNLISFFRQIQSDGYYQYQNDDTISILNDLLQRAEMQEQVECLLPFLRILDPFADQRYKDNCIISPKVTPFICYCAEEKVRYLMLFYIHFVIVKPIRLNDGEILSKIRLIKKEGKEPYVLLEDDYKKIYIHYYNWLKNVKLTGWQENDPLYNTDYRWEIEVQQL